LELTICPRENSEGLAGLNTRRIRSERLLEADIALCFFAEMVEQARGAEILSDEHFSVDGTLIQAWATKGAEELSAGGIY
jgi:hypothetical protein